MDPKQHPVLLAEPSFNTRQARERATELLFEKYQVPALFTAKNAVLALYVVPLVAPRDSRTSLTRISGSHQGEAQVLSWTRAVQ